MYIRTKDKNGIQYIRKVVDLPKDIRDGSIIVDKYIHNVKWVSKKNVLKSSYEKMDLIKSGDYVNGKRVYNISIVDGLKYLDVEVEDYLSDMPFINADQIESIVTKEQFEDIKYEVNKDE
nr:MAG TPA: hypothetical protein [Caudoviricetes sp.]